MTERNNDDPRQLVLVPYEGKAAVPPAASRTRARRQVPPPRRESSLFPRAVLAGSFRKDLEGLRVAFQSLVGEGCEMLSPKNVTAVAEQDGFVYMSGETGFTPEAIERRHLDSILQADFVWLHAPDGYVGISAAMEIGFAHASGVPVFCSRLPADSVLRSFVVLLPDVRSAVEIVRGYPVRVPPALEALRHYYARAAMLRSYDTESARNCLVLLVEEVGELAHVIRKQDALPRDHPSRSTNMATELADVMLYVVHMANIAGVDLSKALAQKEDINRERFLSRIRNAASGVAP